MRIVCPSCETAYQVPESIVTGRRRMRCARCLAEFVPDAPLPVVAAAPMPEPEPEQAPEPPATAPSPMPLLAPDEGERLAMQRPPDPAEPAPALRGAVLAGWAASLALLVVLGWSAIVWRHPIERAWPPAARVYLALGYK